jgi:hypothetical protein
MAQPDVFNIRVFVYARYVNVFIGRFTDRLPPYAALPNQQLPAAFWPVEQQVRLAMLQLCPLTRIRVL